MCLDFYANGFVSMGLVDPYFVSIIKVCVLVNELHNVKEACKRSRSTLLSFFFIKVLFDNVLI